jgi:hypothetical protein
MEGLSDYDKGTQGYQQQQIAGAVIGGVVGAMIGAMVNSRANSHREKRRSTTTRPAPLRIAHMEWEVHEGFVDIYRTETHELVAGIEFVSPTNKTNSKGRRLYRQKQRDFNAANVHLVEIDLIRRGPHVLDIPEEVVEELRPWEYFVNLVRRGSEEFEVYPLRLRTPLPRIRIPLLAEDEDAVLDLQDVFNRSFDISPYPDILNYEVDPPPPELSPEDAAWADELLKSKGLRQ